MDYVSFSLIDYSLFALMFGLSIIVGVYYGFCGTQQNTTTDYLLGGKKMKVFPVAMSLVASTLSGISLLSFPAEIYYYGTLYMIVSIAPIITGFAVNFIYLPVFWKLQVTTIFEYLEIRFHRRVRTVASFLYTLTNFLILPLIIYAPSLAFNQVTGFNLHIIAVAMSLLCIFYTTIGGLKAVVWTDTLQLCVTLCTLTFVFVMGTISVGGFGSIWEKAELGNRIEFFNLNPDPTIRSTFWSVLIGTSIGWTALIGATPATAQRFLAVSTLADAKKVLYIYVVFTVITKAICCFSGLIIYARYFDCDPLTAGYTKRPDQIVPYYVIDVAGQIPGLSGLFLAGLFSTALSTLSTFLNCLSGIMFTDFLYPILPKKFAERNSTTFMKIITAMIGLTSVALIFVVEQLGTILEVLNTLSGVTMGPLLGVFTMGMVFPFANKRGALFGVIGSLLIMVSIVIQYQIHMWNGIIKYPKKPLSIEGCNNTLPSLEQNQYTLKLDEDASNEVFWLFRISFLYYITMGTLLTLIIGLFVSWITQDKNASVDPNTISPCIHRFLSKSTLDCKYKVVTKELEALKMNSTIKNIIK